MGNEVKWSFQMTRPVGEIVKEEGKTSSYVFPAVFVLDSEVELVEDKDLNEALTSCAQEVLGVNSLPCNYAFIHIKDDSNIYWYCMKCLDPLGHGVFYRTIFCMTYR